ncbi:MAG: hypothetical protein J7L43_02430 [Candidatus Aenigmarchaeota archaeon]|nr:hypothetical protein [Candidatus Aenigmarchaeota archaeon]
MVGGLGFFAPIVQNLDQLGFYGFVLPWLLVFAIVYAILKKAGIDDRINGVISIAIAFFITAYSGIGTFFVNLLGPAAILLGIILVVVLFFELVGFKIFTNEPKNRYQAALAIGLIVIAVIVGSVYLGGVQLGGQVSQQVWGVVFIVVMMVVVVWFVGGNKEEDKSKKGQQG